ncbi:hypothetical protein BV898_05185 [Hypsibius exemplaris]|uniref:Uncharacterized protein n=1 Tax=Hypsibius exemplaris TaxID=2072580 RepID=A0A1W0X046_HYPEX|nr:hypothetical protein BV898_05185 [Hypsibius exemplaris]
MKHPTGGNKFDEYLRVGKYRRSFEMNRLITNPRMEIGEQNPSRSKSFPKDHAYGYYPVKGPYDNVPAVINKWQTFDQDDYLRKYANEYRRLDAIKANNAALDAGISRAKPWNEFCRQHHTPDMYYSLPEDTQKTFLNRRRVKIPDLPLKPRPQDEHEMNRIMSMDYGRKWLLRQIADKNHGRNVKEIDGVSD